MNTQDNPETTDNIENMDAAEATTAHETIESVESEQATTVEALPQSERSEHPKPRKKLAVPGLPALLVLLALFWLIFPTLIGSGLFMTPTQTVKDNSKTCITVEWKVSGKDIKDSAKKANPRLTDEENIINYHKFKHPESTPFSTYYSCSK